MTITTEELARIRTAAIGDMLGDSKALDEMGLEREVVRISYPENCAGSKRPMR